MKDGVRHLVARLSDAWGALWGGVPAGRVYAYEARLDAGRSASTRRLSFERIEAILDSARSGYITEALEMFAEMEARDARLKSVAAIRRLALTGLDYEILSAAEGGAGMVDKSLADEAAAYVRETLSDLGGQFAQALEHLATAIGPNLAVLEMVWENARPIALVAIPNHRLTMDLQKSPHVRVITAGNAQGIETDGAKWVVHVPHAISGSPIDRSLAIAQVWIWLIKKLSLSDWATFCELFGMPLRIGKYRPAASPEEKRQLSDMLKNLGSAGWAMVSEASAIEFAESSQRTAGPYEAILNFCNREQAVLWLGGNLTSDTTGGTGTYGAATVQNEVRADLRNDDIQREARTVMGQIIGPMVAFKFPGRNVSLPIFRRVKPETVDRIAEANLFRAAQAAGVRIPKAWAYKRLSIPEPANNEESLEPVEAFVSGVAETETPE
ncbi:MAG: DUF935 family protein [Planctomycetota bacterium]